MINDFQKRLYNLHLATYKRHQKKPYTHRMNFDNFEREKPEETLWLLKLEKFFTNYSKINIKQFFDAPYVIHEDKDYFSLEFYTAQAAINTYRLYMKQAETQLPDSICQLEYIKDSLKFIKEFCIKQKIRLVDYMFYKEGLTYSWAVHIAEHKTSIYAIMGFSLYTPEKIYDHMFEMPDDEREMLLGDIVNNFPIYKAQFEKSVTAKQLLIKGQEVINKEIEKSLNNTCNSDDNIVNYHTLKGAASCFLDNS